MTERHDTGIEQAALDWFVDGPTAAPANLLEATLDRSSRTRQRSALVATLTHPNATGVRPAGGPRMRLAIILAALLVTLLAVVLGGGSRRPELVAVLPSTQPADTHPSREPTSLRPISTEQPAATPTGPQPIGLGISVEPDSYFRWTRFGSPWAAHAGSGRGFDQWGQRFVYERCADPCGLTATIDMTIGTTDTGLIVGWNGCPDPANPMICGLWAFEGGGATPVFAPAGSIADLKSTWKSRHPDAEFSTESVNGRSWTIAREPDHIAALIVVDTRRLVVVEGSTNNRDATDNEARFDAFLDGIRFGSPVTTQWRDLTLTTPETWVLRDEGTAVQIATGEGAFPLGDVEFRIVALEPGSTTQVSRAYAVDTAATFEVGGSDLAEVRQSIEAILGAPTETTIAGRRAYRWSAQQIQMRTLATVAVLESRGSFYLLLQYLPIDGPTQPWWDDFVDGISFE